MNVPVDELVNEEPGLQLFIPGRQRKNTKKRNSGIN